MASSPPSPPLNPLSPLSRSAVPSAPPSSTPPPASARPRRTLSSSSGAHPSSSSAATGSTGRPSGYADPVLRNAIRYTVSAREYALLHRYVLSRSRAVRRRVPAPEKEKSEGGTEGEATATKAGGNFEPAPWAVSPEELRRAESRVVPGSARTDGNAGGETPRDRDRAGGAGIINDEDYNARAVRHAIRVFLLTGTALKAWDLVKKRFLARRHEGESRPAPSNGSHPTLRASLSLSLTLLLYRLLFRFLARLRAALLSPAARPFRERNPRIAAWLTSAYAPSVGASLAGLALGLFPGSGGSGVVAKSSASGAGGKAVGPGGKARAASAGAGAGATNRLRQGIALYALFRAAEWAWDLAEGEGWVWGWEALKRGGVRVGSTAASAVAAAANVAGTAATAAASSGAGAVATAAGAAAATVGAVMVKRDRPWWFGSWLLQPLAFAQLLDAVVFERDCFPVEYGNFIFGNSPGYIHPRPAGYPAHLKWPGAYDVVDSLREMARLKWPAFTSPTLFPSSPPLPSAAYTSLAAPTTAAALTKTLPLSSIAHPLITHLSCATLHPSDPSCSRTFLSFWISTLPPLTRSFLMVHAAFLVLARLRPLYHRPLRALRSLLARSLAFAVFATGSVGTAWASVCAFQHLLPGRVLPRARFALGGAVAGLWAYALHVPASRRRRHVVVGGKGAGAAPAPDTSSRQIFLYSARMAADSLWRSGVKRGWWKGVRGGDVLVFVAALALAGAVYEREREREERVDRAELVRVAGLRGEALVVRRSRVGGGEGGEGVEGGVEDVYVEDAAVEGMVGPDNKGWMKAVRWVRGEGWAVEEDEAEDSD